MAKGLSNGQTAWGAPFFDLRTISGNYWIFRVFDHKYGGIKAKLLAAPQYGHYLDTVRPHLRVRAEMGPIAPKPH
tara:strand:+ start:252 stop:476 length:225 start_codon:yes stop_codon:yes gene_type:complete